MSRRQIPPRRISYAGLPLLFTQCNAATSVPVYLYLSRTRWHSPGLQLAVLTVRWSGVTSVAGEKTLVAARVVSVWFRGRRSGRDTRGEGRGDKSPNYPEVLGTLFYPGGLNGRGVPGGAVEPPSRDDRSSSSNPECLFGLATYLSLFCLHWERSRGR